MFNVTDIATAWQRSIWRASVQALQCTSFSFSPGCGQRRHLPSWSGCHRGQHNEQAWQQPPLPPGVAVQGRSPATFVEISAIRSFPCSSLRSLFATCTNQDRSIVLHVFSSAKCSFVLLKLCDCSLVLHSMRLLTLRCDWEWGWWWSVNIASCVIGQCKEHETQVSMRTRECFSQHTS